MMNVSLNPKLIEVDASGWGRSRQSHMMEPLVLYLDLDVQLRVFVPNLLVGAAKVDMGAETTLNTQLCLLLIHSLRLFCKAWKTIVDKNAVYMFFVWLNMNTPCVPMMS
jgi:hypothetical protein